MSTSGLGDELEQSIEAKNFEAAPAIFGFALGDALVDSLTHRVCGQSGACFWQRCKGSYQNESKKSALCGTGSASRENKRRDDS